MFLLFNILDELSSFFFEFNVLELLSLPSFLFFFDFINGGNDSLDTGSGSFASAAK